MQSAPISNSIVAAAGVPSAAQSPLSAAGAQSPFPILFQGALRGSPQPQIAAQRVPDRGKAQDSARAWNQSAKSIAQSVAGAVSQNGASPSNALVNAGPLSLALQIALSGAAVPTAPVPAANPSISASGSFGPASAIAVDNGAGASLSATSVDAAGGNASPASNTNARPIDNHGQSQIWSPAVTEALAANGAVTPEMQGAIAPPALNTATNASPTTATRGRLSRDSCAPITVGAVTGAAPPAAPVPGGGAGDVQPPSPASSHGEKTTSAFVHAMQAMKTNAGGRFASSTSNPAICLPPENQSPVHPQVSTRPQAQSQDLPAPQETGASLTTGAVNSSSAILAVADPSNSSVTLSVSHFASLPNFPDAAGQSPAVAPGTAMPRGPTLAANKPTNQKTSPAVGGVALRGLWPHAATGGLNASASSNPPAKSAGNDAEEGCARGGSQHGTVTVGSRSDAGDAASSPDTPFANSAPSPAPAANAAVLEPTIAAIAASQTPQTTLPATSSNAHAGTSGSGPADGTAPQPARSLPASAEMASPASVNVARLVDRGGQTEMRIEMQSDSLGGVELRARMAGDQVGAAIVVERHDIHSALSNELPALHSALVEKDLRVQTLSISQGMQTLLGSGSGTEMNGRGFERPYAKAQSPTQSTGATAGAEPPQEWTGPVTINGRLSVLA